MAEVVFKVCPKGANGVPRATQMSPRQCPISLRRLSMQRWSKGCKWGAPRDPNVVPAVSNVAQVAVNIAAGVSQGAQRVAQGVAEGAQVVPQGVQRVAMVCQVRFVTITSRSLARSQ